MNQNPKLLIVILVLSFSFEASGILGIYTRNLYFWGLKIFKVLILKKLFLFSNLVNQFLGKHRLKYTQLWFEYKISHAGTCVKPAVGAILGGFRNFWRLDITGRGEGINYKVIPGPQCPTPYFLLPVCQLLHNMLMLIAWSAHVTMDWIFCKIFDQNKTFLRYLVRTMQILSNTHRHNL